MKVALIGFGTAGEARLGAYRPLAGVTVTTVVDPSPARRERARALDPTVRVHATLAEHLATARQSAAETGAAGAAGAAVEAGDAVDAVDICTPPVFHRPLTLEALGAGLHVICEKPVAFAAADAEELVAASRKARRLLYPAHNYAFSPMMRLLAEVRDEGVLGTPLRASFVIRRATHARGVDGWAPDWRRDPGIAGGGILLDHGSHCVYLATRLFGAAPEKVSATVDRAASPAGAPGTPGAAGVEEAVRARLHFAGHTCEIDLSWTSGVRENAYVLAGPNGRLEIQDGSAVLDAGGTHRAYELTSPTRNSTHEEWFADMFADFAASLDDPDRWEAPYAEILSTARVIESAYRSAERDGSLVGLDET